MIPSAVSSVKMERHGNGSKKLLTCCTLQEHPLGGVAGDSREALTLASSGDMKFEREIALECEKIITFLRLNNHYCSNINE